MQKKTYFERAIFLSWYCSKADCKFCFMSTQNIKNPKKSKRDIASIYAEALISKICGWKIEFISGGYDSFTIDEIVQITKNIYKITAKKQWLNIGTLTKRELKKFQPYIEGITATYECPNLKLRNSICPSKPLSKIEDFLEIAQELNLKKTMTLIIGLGESFDDFDNLKTFIKKHKIDKITFYSLNPHKGTPFKQSPPKKYYAKWIKLTRKTFPNLKIVAGTWFDKTDYISKLIEAGADNITKFPATSKFGSKEAYEIEKQVELAGREFKGTLTELPSIDWDKEVDKLTLDKPLKEKIKVKLHKYVQSMSKKKF